MTTAAGGEARKTTVMPACGGMHSLVDCRAELGVRRGNNRVGDMTPTALTLSACRGRDLR